MRSLMAIITTKVVEKIIVLELLLLTWKMNFCDATFVNQRLTGIEFSPYIKADGMQIKPSKNSFTIEHVKTMLKVVSTRFSRVFIMNVDAKNCTVSSDSKTTYYHHTTVRARTAEIAAKINKERKNLSLTVVIGIWDTGYNQQDNANFHVALEAYDVANSIFPGTVEGIMLSHLGDNLFWSKGILRKIEILRNISSKRDLKIGIRGNCDRIKANHITDSVEILEVQKNIIMKSDFVICRVSATYDVRKLGGTYAFRALQPIFLRHRYEVKCINKNIDVVWYTFWQRTSENETKWDIDNSLDYWHNLNQFSARNNNSIWIHGAFDNPRNDFYVGWWKLTRYELINNVSGYVEKMTLGADNGQKAIMAYKEKPDESFNISGTFNDSSYENFNDKKSSSTKVADIDEETALIIGGLIIGFTLASIFTVCGCMIFKRGTSNTSIMLSKQDMVNFRRGLSDTPNVLQDNDDILFNLVAHKHPYDTSLEMENGRFEIMLDEWICDGKHTRVLRAVIEDETGMEKEVALKMAKSNCGATAFRELLSEIKILSYIGKHPNIVSILGAYTAEIRKGTVYLATEICSLGSLKQVLQRFQDVLHLSDTLSNHFSDMIRWSYEITRGMAYLEEMQVIHGDLAARNVLLTSERVIKISGFGLSRNRYQRNIYTKTLQEPLPWRWMAIESLKVSDFSTKSDVWSFGITLWEIFSSGAQPYPGLVWTTDFIETLENGCKLPKPIHATSEIYETMKTCWNLESAARPSFVDLKNVVRQMQTTAMDALYTSLTCSAADNNSYQATVVSHYDISRGVNKSIKLFQ